MRLVSTALLFVTVLFVTSQSSESQYKEQKISFENCTSVDALSRHVMKILHDELDRDDDGSVTASEGVKYVLGHENHGENTKASNKNLPGFENDIDGRITEQEFWDNWLNSRVYNWTVADMIDWLSYDVELPQYAVNFHVLNLTGCAMPILANNGSIVLRIVDKENKLKLMLKAKEAVLLGPRKRKSSWLKDVFMTLSLMFAISGVAYGFKVQRVANNQLQVMQDKFTALQATMNKMEDDTDINWYKDIQEQDDEKSNVSEDSGNHVELSRVDSDLESRLKEVEVELAQSKQALKIAEHRIKDYESTYKAPVKLRALLRITFDNESKLLEVKKNQVQKKIEQAKSQFLKMKRHRTSLIGMIQFVHSKQADDLDYEVQNMNKMILELQQSSKERMERWIQIEKLSACKIIPSAKRDLNGNKEMILSKIQEELPVVLDEPSTSSSSSRKVHQSSTYSVLSNLGHKNGLQSKSMPHVQSQTFPPKPRQVSRSSLPSNSSITNGIQNNHKKTESCDEGLKFKRDNSTLSDDIILSHNSRFVVRPKSVQSLNTLDDNKDFIQKRKVFARSHTTELRGSEANLCRPRSEILTPFDAKSVSENSTMSENSNDIEIKAKINGNEESSSSIKKGKRNKIKSIFSRKKE